MSSWADGGGEYQATLDPGPRRGRPAAPDRTRRDFVRRAEGGRAEQGLGPAVASFANTLGGWLLLGVTDAGEIVGFDPGSGDFTDKMRHKLRSEIEPLPPFAATLVDLEEKQVGVIRVFESLDTPHLVIRSGSIPVREPGGTRNIRDRSELIDLARRGEDARLAAEERLRKLPYLQGRIAIRPEAQGQSLRQIIVRLAPLTRNGDLADRILGTPFGRAAHEVVRDLFPGPPAPDPRHRRADLSFGQRGFTATATQMGDHHRSSVIADAGGVVATCLEYPRLRPPQRTHLRPEGVEEDRRSLFGALVSLSDALDSNGRAVCDLIFRGYEGVEFVHQRAGSGQIPGEEVHISGEIALPPDDGDIDQIARAWSNELARSAGLEVWHELTP